MRLGLALLVCLILAPPARAEMGSGAYPNPYGPDVRTAGRAKPLREIGEDVIRFSSTPFAGRGWIIEVHPQGPTAVAEMSIFKHVGLQKWNLIGQVRFDVPAQDYEDLGKTVDDLLAQGPPKEGATSTPGSVLVCADGPGWLTERRVHGRETWLTGFCAEHHPNATIAKAMTDMAGKYGLPNDFTRGSE